MKKNIKFLLLGAMTASVFSFAHADSYKINKTSIKENIENIIKNQLEEGFFTEHSKFSINFENSKNKKSDIQNTSLRLGDICTIQLSFDNKGNIPYLGKDEELMKITKLQNEKQREIARIFVALHEQSHCEFSTIENPVKVKGMNEILVKRLNYYLKDMEVVGIFNDNVNIELSYINTLNESYSDVYAIALLIKEHGIENTDLQYVIKTVEVQRKDRYIQNSSGDYNTHSSIEILLKPENIKKINSLSNAKEFQDFVLKIANEGVQKLMSEKREIIDKSFSYKNFNFSVVANMLRVAKEKTISISERKGYQSHKWKDENQTGMTYTIAKEFLTGVDLKKFNIEGMKVKKGEEPQSAFEFMFEVLNSNDAKMKSLELSYEVFVKTIAEFKTEVYKNNEMKLANLGLHESAEEISVKVNEIRNKFIVETKSLGGTLNSLK